MKAAHAVSPGRKDPTSFKAQWCVQKAVAACKAAYNGKLRGHVLPHSSCQVTVLAVSADLVELVKGLQPLYVVQLVVLFLYRPHHERRQQQCGVVRLSKSKSLIHLRIIGLQVDGLLFQPRVRRCSEVVPPCGSERFARWSLSL